VLAVLLVLATLAVYAPVTRFEFVDYDDRDYVAENVHVRAGLTRQTVGWALTARVVSHWHPLTMLSHALDWTVFGGWAGGHHATNVVLHALNVLLLFALLARTTGAPHRSALVAALFALHPLRVESVAWVAERKDVLSAAFFFATLHAYVEWVRRPSAVRHALVLCAFACGLLAKPMVLTLPLVTLLLDRWPLARATPPRARLVEKIPLFALALGSALVTLSAARAQAMAPLANSSFGGRAANAIVSLGWYLEKTVWPSGLGVLYLHPAVPGAVPLDAWMLAASVALVAGVSAWVWRTPRFPYLATGWGWYVVMLLPVLGFVQAGIQARADRYTYLPLVGVYLMIVWRAGDALAGRTLGTAARRALAAAVVLVLLGYAGLTRRQLLAWRNSEALYRNAIAVEPRNFMMRYNLGTVLAAAGRHDEALAEFERALAIHPRYPPAHRAFGSELERVGRVEEAIRHHREAVHLDPRDAASLRLLGDALLAHGEASAAVAQYRAALAVDAGDAHTQNNLGNALLAEGDGAGARAAYERAVVLDPALAGARGNLAARLEAAGDWPAALEQRREHVRLDPESAEAQQALAAALLRAGDDDAALAALRAARRLDPRRPDTRRLLAWVLATRPRASAADGAEALRLAEEGALPGSAADAVDLTTLAVAQAAAGHFDDALATAARARTTAVAAGDTDLVDALDDMQERFRRGEPYRGAS
jgi:tetratricopeptide (TPR) repeat protein